MDLLDPRKPTQSLFWSLTLNLTILPSWMGVGFCRKGQLRTTILTSSEMHPSQFLWRFVFCWTPLRSNSFVFFWLKSQKSDEIQNVGCLYTKTGTSETYCFKALSSSEEEEDQVWNFQLSPHCHHHPYHQFVLIASDAGEREVGAARRWLQV